MIARSGASTASETQPVDVVRQLWAQARAQGNNGHPLSAVRTANHALGLLLRACPDERTLHARILLTLAYQRAELGELSAAMSLLDEAVEVDKGVLPLAEASRAGLLTRNGRPREAMPHFELAISGLRDDRTKDGLEALAIASLNRGVLQMSAGNLRAAQADTQTAENAAKASGVDALTFMSTHNLGYVRFLSGDLPGALDTMAAASEFMPMAATGVSAMDRARVLFPQAWSLRPRNSSSRRSIPSRPTGRHQTSPRRSRSAPRSTC